MRYLMTVLALTICSAAYAAPPRARCNPPVAYVIVPPTAVVVVPQAKATSAIVVESVPVQTLSTYTGYTRYVQSSSCPGGNCPNPTTSRRFIFR